MAFLRSLWLPVLAISATLFAIWYAQQPAQQIVSTPAQVREEAEAGGYRLIDLDGLSAMYGSEREKILLVDTRQEWEHRAGHIEGSVNFPMDPTWWARWRKKSALITFLGPDKQKTIVFY